jgi:hypothetical protein
MHIEEFRNAAHVLSKKEATDILMLLSSTGNWMKASDVSGELGIHTATAVKYLSALAGLEYLQYRRGKGKTKEVVEYRLRDRTIKLSLNLLEMQQNEGETESLLFILGTLTMKVDRISGSQVEDDVRSKLDKMARKHGIDLWPGARSIDKNAISKMPGKHSSQFIIEAINIIISGAERNLGKITTAALMDSVKKAATKRHPNMASNAFRALPPQYFGD